MGTIAKADFLVLADSIAAQTDQLSAVQGDGSGHAAPATISDSVRNILEDLILNIDPEVISALQGDFEKMLLNTFTVPNAYSPFKDSVAALNSHVAGVNAYLTAQAERVAPQFKTVIQLMVGEILDPANTFSPIVADMGEWKLTGFGPNIEVFTDGDAIDTNNYYASHLQLKKTSVAHVAAAAAFILEVTCTDWAGTSTVVEVTVDPNDALDTLYDIGVALPVPSDMYTDVTGIAYKAATPPDVEAVNETWQVVSQLERTVTL